MTAGIQALADIRIAEFGSYAAGPHIGKMLANFGATVVHVESRARPDGFRLQYPPYKDDQPGIDSGGCFAYFNDSKSASPSISRIPAASSSRAGSSRPATW